MIYSNIHTWRKEEQIYSERFQKALTFIENMNLSTVKDEKFIIEEGNIFGFVTTINTEEAALRRPESHTKHIDIQFLVEGREKMGYIRKSSQLAVVSDELQEKDNCFYDGNIEGEVFLDLKPGDFAVFFPEDVHRPGCMSGENTLVRKCVIKIKVD